MGSLIDWILKILTSGTEDKKKAVLIVVAVFGVGYLSFFKLIPWAWETAERYFALQKLDCSETHDICVLVASYVGPGLEKFEVQAEGEKLAVLLAASLDEIFESENIKIVMEIKPIPYRLRPNFKEHLEARQFGKEHNTDLVIWGDRHALGGEDSITVRSRVTVVDTSRFPVARPNLTFSRKKIKNGLPLPAEFVNDLHILTRYVGGLALLLENRREEAFILWEELLDLPQRELRLEPEIFGNLYGNIGATAYNIQEYESAVPYFEKALEAKPHDYDVLNELGLAYGSIQERYKAIEIFEKLLNVDPEHAKETLVNLGTQYGYQRQHKLARIQFQKVLQIDPDYIPALVNVAAAYFESYFEYLVKSQLENPQARAILDSFIQYSNRGLVRQPEEVQPSSLTGISYAKLYNVLGNHYYYQKQVDLARICFEKSVARDTADCDAWGNLGAMYTVQEKYQKAIAAIKRSTYLCKSYFVPNQVRIAAIYARALKQDSLFQTLEQLQVSLSDTVQNMLPAVTVRSLIEQNADIQEYRDHPRYKTIMR